MTMILIEWWNIFIWKRPLIKKEEKDLKNLVVLSKTCSIDGDFESQNELIATENNAIKVILDFEKKSNEDIFDPFEVERYCKAFYEEGLKAEKIIKGRK